MTADVRFVWARMLRRFDEGYGGPFDADDSHDICGMLGLVEAEVSDADQRELITAGLREKLNSLAAHDVDA